MTRDAWSEDDSSASVWTYVRSIGDHARTVNRERAASLADALRAASRGVLDTEGRHAAAQLAHQLVGSAGTFGFPIASQLAAELERFFEEGRFDDREQLNEARRQLADLQRELNTEPAQGGDFG